VGDWCVTVGVVVTVVDITVGEIDITVGTMVDTVEEGWFIAVVGVWWGGFAEQGKQTQPPTSPRENMDQRVPEWVQGVRSIEWTHLLQRLHWIEVRPTLREQTEQEYLVFVGAGVKVNIAACKWEVENKETSEGR